MIINKISTYITHAIFIVNCYARLSLTVQFGRISRVFNE